jgi:hypothetical protein
MRYVKNIQNSGKVFLEPTLKNFILRCSLIGLDYLQGEFYEDVTGHLFLVGKISIKALVFYNPQDNVFKLIYGNYYNTPPFMYMIKSKRKLQKVNEYDLNKLGLKISNSNKIPFDI